LDITLKPRHWFIDSPRFNIVHPQTLVHHALFGVVDHVLKSSQRGGSSDHDRISL
jgi:hypothetical protein